MLLLRGAGCVVRIGPSLTPSRLASDSPALSSGYVQLTMPPEEWAIFWAPRRRPVTEAIEFLRPSIDETRTAYPFLEPGDYRESTAPNTST
jgi:hypothetical protein